MNEVWYMILAFIAGTVLGALFFGGLWLTVKKCLTAKAPIVWVIGSFFVRVSITLIGFYWVSKDSWQRLLICLLGFIVARIVIIKFVKRREQKETLNIEANHEA